MGKFEVLFSTGDKRSKGLEFDNSVELMAHVSSTTLKLETHVYAHPISVQKSTTFENKPIITIHTMASDTVRSVQTVKLKQTVQFVKKNAKIDPTRKDQQTVLVVPTFREKSGM